MKKDNSNKLLLIILISVLILSVVSLYLGDYLATRFDVIGIRIAVLIVAFASFGASTVFSLTVHLHNKTVSKINDDSNRRSEMFRELQFASDNYSSIEINDRALIYPESTRYIPRFHNKETPSFHLQHENINLDEELVFYTIRLPFRVSEGKSAGSIKVSLIKFERNFEVFNFIPMEHEKSTRAYLLYNEQTKRNNIILNLAFNKNSEFFKEEVLNVFTKIKISLSVTSILGVTIKGTSELYFTNPTQIEGAGSSTYKINSSNFRLTQKPSIENFSYDEED